MTYCNPIQTQFGQPQTSPFRGWCGRVAEASLSCTWHSAKPWGWKNAVLDVDVDDDDDDDDDYILL